MVDLPDSNTILTRQFAGYKKLDNVNVNGIVMSGMGLVFKCVYQMPDGRQVPYYVTLLRQLQYAYNNSFINDTLVDVSTDEPKMDYTPNQQVVIEAE